VAGALTRWFCPGVPCARARVFRVIICVFVLVDIHVLVNDPIPLSHSPELYHPLLLARLLHLPTVSVPLAYALYAAIWLGCLLGITGRAPRAGGVMLAAAFTWWTMIGFGYGKVDHDHLALVVALWVLPSAPGGADALRTPGPDERAGWALRCVQIAVVATYALSAVTKLRSGGWDVTSWPSSAILTWAIVRRPHGLGQFLLPYPQLLRVLQWIGYLAEWCSVVVLWLRGRALLGAAIFWLGFHLTTAALLYIHFAPTLVCWLAFAPLERLSPWLAARWVRGRESVLGRVGWRRAGRRERASG
jgi:hypothetical protein